MSKAFVSSIMNIDLLIDRLEGQTFTYLTKKYEYRNPTQTRQIFQNTIAGLVFYDKDINRYILKKLKTQKRKVKAQ